MADEALIPQIDPTEIEILIEKLEQNKLEERERRLIAALLRTFLTGRILSLAVDGGMDKYGGTIRALFFIDAAGFALSIAASFLERLSSLAT